MSLGRVSLKRRITRWEEVNICFLSNFFFFFQFTYLSFQVGVTGSGKGMTEVALKSKHKFEIKDDDGQ